MNIQGKFTLNVVTKDGVHYIEWSYPMGDTELEKCQKRWSAYCRQARAGKDAHGSFFNSKAEAQRVIRAFKARESSRSARAARAAHEKRL